MIDPAPPAGDSPPEQRPILERYGRQATFPGIGLDGQRRIQKSRAVVCGCGALGSVQASTLARAGVGHLRIVDRDVLELSNLQRQVLFDEADVAEGLPKAEAAARKLAAINSSIRVEAVVTDIDPTNVLELVRDADVILDGTDNFETRYLLNDAAVKTGTPWIFGGCLGSQGQVLAILPGETACLRCFLDSGPAPGTAPTCETAGILATTVNVVASLQATEALKILAGRREAVCRELIAVDVWEGSFRRLDLSPLREAVDCPTCRRRDFEWLDGRLGSHTTSLCGRNAVQVAHRSPVRLSFEDLERRLSSLGPVIRNRFLLRFEAEGHRFTLFPDGRAIIQGTDDVNKARTLYAKYIGT